jgi:hypothetical protein
VTALLDEPYGGTPIAGWFVMEISQSKMMDELGVPPWIGNLHVRTRFCPFGYQRLEPICTVNYCKVNFGLIYPRHIPSNIQKHPPKMVMISMISTSGWWFGTFLMTFHMLGMLSSQLTFIFFREVG